MQPSWRLGLVIVTYQAEPYLPSMFASLEKQNYPSDLTELIVVENASTDGTRQWLEQYQSRSPWHFTYLPQEQNRLFVGGNNIGLRRALELGCDGVVLLNQDTEVAADWLNQLASAMQVNPQAGAIQPKMLLHPRTDLINTVGNSIHFLGFGYAGGNGEPDKPATNQRSGVRQDALAEVAYCSGAAALYRAEALRQVGLFPEEFQMYHEDLDLGWRLRLAGWQNLVEPRAVVYHKYQFSKSVRKFYWMEKNRWLVLLLNYRWRTLLLLMPWLLVMEFGQLLFAALGGFFRLRLSVYRYLAQPSLWRWIHTERHWRQRTRQVGDQDIVRLFSGRIDYQEVQNPLWRVVNALFDWSWRFLLRPLVRW